MPKRGEAVEPEVAQVPAGESKQTVKKFLLVEKAKKYFAKINPEILEHVHQIMEKSVEDEEKNKNVVCFVTFSDKGCTENDPVNDEKNVEIIKEILLAYHTLPETKPSGNGKVISLEVLSPEEDTPHILMYQEFSIT